MYEHLAPITKQDTEKARLLLSRLFEWLSSLPTEGVQNQRYNAALDSVNKAILDTRKYLKHLREGGDRNRRSEEVLSGLWADAAINIQPYDSNLASLCWVKGNGWADETTWSAPENIGLPIKVDQMLQQVRKLAKNPPIKAFPNWFPIAGAIFTLFSLISLFYLLLIPEAISPSRRVVFDVWVAFCLASSVSFLGGNAKAQGRLPWFGNSPIQFAAVGGIGVFVVAFVILYSAYH